MNRPTPYSLLAGALSLLAIGCGSGTTERRDDFAVEGIDVSHHQRVVDWGAVASDGIDFAYLKATEGGDHVDTHFAHNWSGAKGAGIARGAYHFFRPRTPARAQIDNFTAVVALEPGDLPPVIDVETDDGASRYDLITRLRSALYLTEIRLGTKPIIYTNLKFYYLYLAGHFDDYDFWFARYGRRQPEVGPAVDVAFWQYGERGEVAGVDGPVDLNVFLGDSLRLEDMKHRDPALTRLSEAGWPVAGR